MADKDFRVKNRLHVNGLTNTSGVILATNNALDSHTNVPTQYGGTGTTQSPAAGQVLYSPSGTTYTPTALSSVVTQQNPTDGRSGNKIYVGTTTPTTPVSGDIWVDNTAAADIITTKGDLPGYTGTSLIRLAVGSNGQLLTADSTNQVGFAWKDAPVSLPTQTGNAGEFLITNGTSASWSNTITANSPSTIGLIVEGHPSGQSSPLQQWRPNSSSSAVVSISSTGNFSAVTKSFDIVHPTKENMRLRYASLEGPENGVYVRGKSKDKIIALPDYWAGLVDENSITVHLTAIGTGTLYVDFIANNSVKVGGTAEEFFYIIHAERKDVDKLIVEY